MNCHSGDQPLPNGLPVLECAIAELSNERIADKPEAVKEKAKILVTLATVRSRLRHDSSQDDFDSITGNLADVSRNVALAAHNNKASMLWEQGYKELAIAELQNALDKVDPPSAHSDAEHWAQWALCKRNLGVKLGEVGVLDAADQALGEAKEIFTQLAQRQSQRFLGELVKTEHAMASYLIQSDRLEDAILELGELWHRVNKSVIHSDHDKVHFLAGCAKNMGLAATLLGKASHARRYQALSLQYFLKLQRVAPDESDSEVLETRLTTGDLLKRQGKYTDAVVQFEAAVAGFEAMRKKGRDGFLLEEAVARETLALGYLATGVESDLPRASQLLRAALSIHAELDTSRYPEAPLACVFTATALARMAESRWFDFLEGPDLNFIGSVQMECKRDLVDAFDALCRIPAQRPHKNTFRALSMVQVLLAHLVHRWPAFMGMQLGMPPEKIDAVSVWLLRQVGEMLTHGHPAKLIAEYDHQIKPILQIVYVAQKYIGGATSLAKFFLYTQGLRAQRQALDMWRHSTDEELQALSGLFDKLEKLDIELLGDRGAESANLSIASSRDFLNAAHSSARRQVVTAERDLLWINQIAPRIQALERAGRLPVHHALTLGEINKRLQWLDAGTQVATKTSAVSTSTARGCAPQARPKHVWKAAKLPSHKHGLIFLLPCPEDEGKSVTVITVTASSGGGSPEIKAQEIPTSFTESSLRDWVDQMAVESGSDGRTFRGEVTIGSSMAASQHGSAKKSWLGVPNMLTGVLTKLSSEGITHIYLVSGGELHLAPWAAELDGFAGLRISQYPTVASWWRVTNDVTDPVPVESRWATLAWDARGSTAAVLAWVGPEARALAAIWNPQDATANNQSLEDDGAQSQRFVTVDNRKLCWPLGDASDGNVTGLIGIGHGAAPAANWAGAGLVVGQQGVSPASPTKMLDDLCMKWRYFSAGDLHRIRHVERLVMSCCTLGRMLDAFGEPVGMTALAFSFKTRFAVGAITPIPDFEGAIFSMCMHWTWEQAEREALAEGKFMDWSGVFHATRREVMAGRWPQRFGTWLERNLLKLCDCDDLKGQRRQFLDAEAGRAGLKLGDKAGLLHQLSMAVSPTVQHVASVFTCLG